MLFNSPGGHWQHHPRDVETTRLEMKHDRGAIRSRACIVCVLPLIVLVVLAVTSFVLALVT